MRFFYDTEADTVLTLAEVKECFEMHVAETPEEFENWTFADYIREVTGKNGTLEEVKTLADFRAINNHRHVSYECDFGCDYETATEANGRVLESWEESGAIITNAYEVNDILYIECKVVMAD